MTGYVVVDKNTNTYWRGRGISHGPNNWGGLHQARYYPTRGGANQKVLAQNGWNKIASDPRSGIISRNLELVEVDLVLV